MTMPLWLFVVSPEVLSYPSLGSRTKDLHEKALAVNDFPRSAHPMTGLLSK